MRNGWRSLFVGMAGLAVWLSAGRADATILVHLNEPVYNVGLGQTLQVEVVLDGDDQIEGDQALSSGLVSMSFGLNFDSAGLSVLEVNLPSALDNNGLNGPPRIELAPSGFVGVRASVYFLADEFYLGETTAGGERRMRLATFEITGVELGEYQLGLRLWQPAGAADEGFVDGDRNTLDSQIVYSGATVRVVPQPTTLAAWTAGTVLIARRRRSIYQGLAPTNENAG